MFILSASGFISLQFWIKNFKYALLIIILFGAIITPDGSGITMWFIPIPMLLLYALGIAIIKLKKRVTSKTFVKLHLKYMNSEKDIKISC